MNLKTKKSNLIISAVLTVLSVFFLCCGIFMMSTSIEYIGSYSETSALSFADAFRYVVSSCAQYIAYAAVLYGIAFIIFSSRRYAPSDASVRTEQEMPEAEISFPVPEKERPISAEKEKSVKDEKEKTEDPDSKDAEKDRSPAVSEDRSSAGEHKREKETPKHSRSDYDRFEGSVKPMRSHRKSRSRANSRVKRK